MKLTDQEYLQKEIIPDVIYKITDNEIYIKGNSTIFTQIKKPSNLIDIKEVNKIVKEIRSICKINNIKVGRKNQYKKKVEENYIYYITTYNMLCVEFEKALQLAKQVKERKIHYGCIDDVVLNQLQDISCKFQRSGYGTEPYSKVNSCYYDLVSLLNQLQRGCKGWQFISI